MRTPVYSSFPRIAEIVHHFRPGVPVVVLRAKEMSSFSRRRSPSPPRRRRSPSPRRERSRHDSSPKRKETDLPKEFTRDRDDVQKDDNKNVLERMEKSYVSGPLEVLNKCSKENLKVKIWTRNFKQMRGICTGFVKAFDKHWNLALRDVDEIGLIPKKGKTPYLRDLKPGDVDTIPEAKPKEYVEKKKKEPAVEPPPPDQEASKEPAPPADQEMKTEGNDSAAAAAAAEGKKKRRRKKKKTKINKRHVNQLFIRGDNIVMLSVISPTDV